MTPSQRDGLLYLIACMVGVFLIGMIVMFAQSPPETQTRVIDPIPGEPVLDCDPALLAERDCENMGYVEGSQEWSECMDEALAYWQSELGVD